MIGSKHKATRENRPNATIKGECIEDKILEVGHDNPQKIIATNINKINIFCIILLAILRNLCAFSRI